MSAPLVAGIHLVVVLNQTCQVNALRQFLHLSICNETPIIQSRSQEEPEAGVARWVQIEVLWRY